MGRRRCKERAKPLDGAFGLVDTIEKRVVAKSISAEIDIERDVFRWMYGDEIVDKLKAAYPYVRGSDKNTVIVVKLTPPGMAATCRLRVETAQFGILYPDHQFAVPGNTGKVWDVINEAYAVHQRFEKVRLVMRWLNANATVGAMRNYCPWLHALLPADHAFHSAGALYREPIASITKIVPVMRECSQIMAEAILAGDNDPPPSVLDVSFTGMRPTDMEQSSSSTEYQSSFLWLA